MINRQQKQEMELSKEEILSRAKCLELNINNILINTIQDSLALAILEQSDDYIKQIIRYIKND